MNEIFEKNLKALEARKPKLADEIRAHSSSTIEVEESKSGELTFKYEGVYFHSRYDPVKEAERLLGELKENGWDYILLFGMGLGYLPRAIQESGGGKLLLFEPSMDILRGVFETIDLTGIINDEHIYITDNCYDVSAIIRAQTLSIDVLGVHVSIAYKKFFLKELSEYTQTITNAQTYNMIRMNTLVDSSEDWFLHYLLNVPNFLKYPSIDILKDSFKGLPVIIVGAGPSLEKNAELLKKVKGRALIIAAITAYKPLVSFGVVPDFVIGIEKFCLKEYFTGTEVDNEIRLMVGDVSHGSIFTDIDAKGIFIIFSAFLGVDKDLNALFGNHFQPLTGGSVTTAALDIAVFLGCSKIILVGQDHAYGSDGSHVKGSVYGEQSIELTDDGMVNVKGKYEFLEGASDTDDSIIVHWLNDVNGDKVMSRYDWVGFHQWIVDYAKLLKKDQNDTEIINATEGGAYIDGLDHMPLIDAIEKFVLPLGTGTDTVEKIISLAESKPRKFDIAALKVEFEKTIFSFKKVQSLCEDTLKRVARIKKSFTRTQNLSRCGKEIKALSKNENKLTPIFDEVSFLKEAASKVGHGLLIHLKKDVLENAQEQFMVDIAVTRDKNVAILKLTRLFEPVLLNVIKELSSIKKSEG